MRVCVYFALGNDSRSIYTTDICISNFKLLCCSVLFVFEFACTLVYCSKWNTTMVGAEKCRYRSLTLQLLFTHWFSLWQCQLEFYTNNPEHYRATDSLVKTLLRLNSSTEIILIKILMIIFKSAAPLCIQFQCISASKSSLFVLNSVTSSVDGSCYVKTIFSLISLNFVLFF